MAVKEVDLGNVVGHSVKKINTNLRNFTTAQWKNYGAEGHQENWNTGSSYDNSHIKVGDIGIITGTVSDAFDRNGEKISASIYGTVIFVDSSKVTMSSIQLVMGSQGGFTQGSNQNLLDNWYFVGGGSQLGSGQFPINQREKTSYSQPGYNVDRWFGGSTSGTITLTEDSMVFFAPVGTSEFSQRLGVSFSDLAGKTVTASLLCKDNIFVYFSGSVPESKPTTNTNIVAGNFDGNKYFRFFYDATLRLFQLAITIPKGSEIKIIAAKVEVGKEQTLASQISNDNWVLNDPPPNYYEELLKCQVYNKEIFIGNSESSSVFVMAVDNSLDFYIPCPIKMRANPAVSINGDIIFYGELSSGQENLVSYSGTGLALDGFVVVKGVVKNYSVRSGFDVLSASENTIKISLNSNL